MLLLLLLLLQMAAMRSRGRAEAARAAALAAAGGPSEPTEQQLLAERVGDTHAAGTHWCPPARSGFCVPALANTAASVKLWLLLRVQKLGSDLNPAAL